MKFEELPSILDGAQAIEWILTGDPASAQRAALGDSEGWAGGWWEAARQRHKLEGRISAVDAALNRLHDALRSGAVRARVAGRDVEAVEWASLGIVDAEPPPRGSGLLVVFCPTRAEIDRQPVAVYRDDLRKLREAATEPAQRDSLKRKHKQRAFLDWLARHPEARGATRDRMADLYKEGTGQPITPQSIYRALKAARQDK